MKKVLSLAFALAMMATMLVGCGSKPAASTPAASTPAASGSATSSAEPVNVIKVDIACVSTPESVIGQATQKLTDLLNESGLFEATCYPNGQYGTIGDCFESILGGDYLMTIGGGSDWGDVVGQPNMGVIMTPFLMDELDDIYGLTESTLWTDMLAGAESNGVKIMNYPAVNGSRYFLTPKVVETPADMAGLMVRTPTSSYYVNAITAFGGTPSAIPVGDLYSSLAQKMVDAAEFTYEATFTRQLYEVCGYMANQPYVTTYDFYGMSTELWNAMSDEQKQVMEESVQAAADLAFEVFPTLESTGKEKLIDKGMVFYDIDVDSFRACLDTFYDLCGWTDEFKSELNTTMENYRASK